MKILFKSTSSIDKATVAETNFLEHYPTFHKATAWKSMVPFVRQSTNTYILKWIPGDLYDALAIKFNAGTSLNEIEAEFLMRIQDSLAFYSVYEIAPHLNVTLGDKGAQQTSSQDGSSTPASQWSFKNMRWEALIKADKLLDELLFWIESKIDDEYFSTFKSSQHYITTFGHIFKTTQDLQDHLDIKNSRRTFVALTSYFDRAAARHVIPLISKSLYTELKTKVKENTVGTTHFKELLDKVKPVIAANTAILAIPHLSLNMESNGFRILSESDGMSHRSNIQNAEHSRAKEALLYQLKEDAKFAKTELIDFITVNAASFPGFIDSAEYNNLVESGKDEIICNGPGGIML